MFKKKCVMIFIEHEKINNRKIDFPKDAFKDVLCALFFIYKIDLECQFMFY